MTARTIRARLAISFGIAFLAVGFVLLALNYTLVQGQFDSNGRIDIIDRLEELGITLDLTLVPKFSDGFDPAVGRPFGDQPITADGRTFTEVLQEVEASVRSEVLNTLLIQGVIAIIAVGVVAAAVGYWLSSRALRPVAEITQTAQSLSEDDLSARVALSGPPDEIKELADTFDAMLDRLERGYIQYRNFAGFASHELRTPLTVIGIEADNVLDDPSTTEEHRLMAKRVLTAVDKSERMIEQLMALTRSTAGLTDTYEVDLADVTGEVLGELSQAATASKLRLDLNLQNARLLGDRTLLSVLVTNLVDNAIVHNVDDGWARISVDMNGSEVRLTVTNSGRLYNSEDVDRMLQPFERIADERTRGTGLGLTTASSIVDAHGGEMRVEPRGSGGLKVTVLFQSMP